MKDINYYYNDNHPLHPFISQGYANIGSLPPLNALRVTPDFKDGFCPCEKDGVWINIPDYRGVTAYDKNTARPVKIDDIGELPDNLTATVPDTDFPKWNGKKWVTDTDAKKAGDVAEAEEKKSYLIAEANQKTQIWQTQLMLGIITDEDKASLTEWMLYVQKVQAVDTSAAPAIIWPEKPE